VENSPWIRQIFERCANGADDSSAGEPEQVLWTLHGDLKEWGWWWLIEPTNDVNWVVYPLVI